MVNFQRTLWLFQALALQCWIPIHSTTEKEKNIFYSLSPKTQHGLLTAWLFIYCWNIIVYFIIIMSVVFCYPENTIKCYLSKKVEKHCIAILTVTFFPFTFSAIDHKKQVGSCTCYLPINLTRFLIRFVLFKTMWYKSNHSTTKEKTNWMK